MPCTIHIACHAAWCSKQNATFLSAHYACYVLCCMHAGQAPKVKAHTPGSWLACAVSRLMHTRDRTHARAICTCLSFCSMKLFAVNVLLTCSLGKLAPVELSCLCVAHTAILLGPFNAIQGSQGDPEKAAIARHLAAPPSRSHKIS